VNTITLTTNCGYIAAKDNKAAL